MLHILKKHMDQRSTNAAITPTLLIHEDTSINSVVSYDRAFSPMMQNPHDSPPMTNAATDRDQPNSLTSVSTATTTDVPNLSPVPPHDDFNCDKRSYEESIGNRNELDLPTNWGKDRHPVDQGTVS